MRRLIALALLTTLAMPAQADIIRQNVRRLSKSGSTGLFGDVTLSEGSNITITQVGNDIAIAASSGSSTTTPLFSHNLYGGVTYANPIDPPSVVGASFTNVQVRVSAANSGTYGDISGVVVKNYPGHANWQTATANLRANGGFNSNLITLSPTMTATSGDSFQLIITGTPNGAPQDYRADFIFY